MNLAINKSLEEQKVLNESKSLELKSALKNLDLANIKISDFEIRVASLIARRTQLISEIAQKDNRIKEEVSRLEASRLALASARQEIDEKVELARLAASKREALELYIDDLKKNLNSISKSKNELEFNKIDSRRSNVWKSNLDNYEKGVLDFHFSDFLDHYKYKSISTLKNQNKSISKYYKWRNFQSGFKADIK